MVTHTNDGGPSKAAERVGKRFNESCRTVERRRNVLKGYDAAVADHNDKKAEHLLNLLEAKKLVEAENIIKGKKAKKPAKPKTAPGKKPVQVEEFPTCDVHFNKAGSVFEAGTALIKSQGDLDAAAQKWVAMWGYIDVARTRNNLETPTVEDSQGRRLEVTCPIPLAAPEGNGEGGQGDAHTA
jgi:hypothetical protein